ncbi:hypothetical protein [Spiroplasma endosymbiont of Phycita roborella]|uniref:hypothetical protein n=1 Tax=Spiroplasma endosymbiont of Phycita roborella TaxID=3066311 RepID=UPI00313C2144
MQKCDCYYVKRNNGLNENDFDEKKFNNIKIWKEYNGLLGIEYIVYESKCNFCKLQHKYKEIMTNNIKPVSNEKTQLLRNLCEKYSKNKI